MPGAVSVSHTPRVDAVAVMPVHPNTHLVKRIKVVKDVRIVKGLK